MCASEITWASSVGRWEGRWVGTTPCCHPPVERRPRLEGDHSARKSPKNPEGPWGWTGAFRVSAINTCGFATSPTAVRPLSSSASQPCSTPSLSPGDEGPEHGQTTQTHTCFSDACVVYRGAVEPPEASPGTPEPGG